MLSFIVPAHNEEHELPGALESIRAAAAASGKVYEIVVVDDDSDDATAEIAANAGARVISVQLRHIAAVRNSGAVAAHGDVFFFVDADTRITPVHITAALQALAKGYVGGSARLALDAAIPFWARVPLGVFSTFYFGANLGIGAFLFTQRESFESVGGFDEQYYAGEEMYLTIALKKLGRFKVLTEPITTSARKMRMHSGWHVFAQWLGMMRGGKEALRTRDKLGLWYDGKREQRGG